MSEAAVVNLFLTARVGLVGGILLVLPRITRKGLLFGVYVGEELGRSGDARRVCKSWDRGCLASMALALGVGLGISAAGWPVRGNLTGTAVLLVAALVVYLRVHRQARALAPPSAARRALTSTAPLEGAAPRGAGLAQVALATCLLVSLATLIYALVAYDAMPAQMPARLGFGPPGELADKSLFLVLLAPVLNLAFSPFYAMLALLTSRAKRSLRGGSGGRSAQAQEAFRTTVANGFSAMALLLCALLALFSVQVVRLGLGQTRSLGSGIWWLGGAMILFLLAYLGRILFVHGQGGARHEEASADAPLTGGLADDSRWILGMFYFDREDPSLLVEQRFGVGYTLNLGHRTSVWILVAFGVLLLALTTLFTIGLMA